MCLISRSFHVKSMISLQLWEITRSRHRWWQLQVNWTFRETLQFFTNHILLHKQNFTTRSPVNIHSHCFINRSQQWHLNQFKSLSEMKQFFIIILFTSLGLVFTAPRRNHHQSSRELAAFVQQFPGTSLEILREVRDNVRRTQTGIKLVLKMERELRRTARNILEENMEHENRNIVKRSEERSKEHPPFSAWAG